MPRRDLRGAQVRSSSRASWRTAARSPPTSRSPASCSAGIETVTGEELRHYAATGLTDARYYALYQDTQATCYGPDADNIHGIDESVGLDSLHDVTQAIALLIAGWCGLEPA